MSDIVRRAPRLDIVGRRWPPRAAADLSPLDSVAGGAMFLHTRANEDVRLVSGAPVLARDASRWRNGLVLRQSIASAPTLVAAPALGGVSVLAWAGVADQHLSAFNVAGCPAGRYLQAHMLMRVTALQAPPAAPKQERVLYVAGAEFETLCALRVETNVEPDNMVALHNGAAGAVAANAVLDRSGSGWFVWSVTSWPDEPARLRKNGSIIASSATNAIATTTAATSVFLPSFSGDPGQIELADLQLLAFTGSESQGFLDDLEGARIDFYADTYNHVVSA